MEVDLDLGHPPGEHPPLQVVAADLDPRSGHLSPPGHAVCCSDHPLKSRVQNSISVGERPEDG